MLNVNHGYVHTSDRFEWIKGAREAIRLLNDSGLLVIVVTNQSGIGRGYYDEAMFHGLCAWIDKELAAVGARIDATYFCPNHPDHGIGRYKVACNNRKPAPGMLEQAAADWNLDKARSFLIGDKASDMAAAKAFGIPGHLFPGGDLLDFVQGVLEREKRED